MSLYSKQPIYCNACGTEYETTFNVGYPNGKNVCSRECFEEMRRRSVLALLGKEFHPAVPSPEPPREEPSK